MKRVSYLQIAAYVMIAAIFIFVMGIARNCGRLPSDPIEGFSRGDTIDIAILYGPPSYYFYSDTLSGINIDIAQTFSQDSETPIKIWSIADPSVGMSKLQSGAFDIVASLPLDNYIKKNFDVSESIFLDRLVLIQLVDSITKNKAINSSLDLNGKTVYITPGSSALQRLKNLGDEIGGQIEIIEDPEMSDELLTLKVATGSIPLAVVNERVAQKLSETYPYLNYDSSVSFTQFQVWIFNKKDSILPTKFNEWFKDFHTTDKYRSIINKY